MLLLAGFLGLTPGSDFHLSCHILGGVWGTVFLLLQGVSISQTHETFQNLQDMAQKQPPPQCPFIQGPAHVAIFKCFSNLCLHCFGFIGVFMCQPLPFVSLADYWEAGGSAGAQSLARLGHPPVPSGDSSREKRRRDGLER